MTNEKVNAISYIRAAARSIDGAAWILTCLLSLVVIVDSMTASIFASLIDVKNAGKILVISLFSPVIMFVVMVWLRQLLDSENAWIVFARAALLIVLFFIINVKGI